MHRTMQVTRTKGSTLHALLQMTQPSLTADAPSIDPAQLEITRLRALRGPNYWRLAPVVVCDVHLGTLESITTADANSLDAE